MKSVLFCFANNASSGYNFFMIDQTRTTPLKIIGLDPGSINFGYSVLESNGSNLRSVEYGVIKPDKKAMLPERLLKIYEGLDEIFSRNKPDIVSIEEIFYHKNIRSAIILAEARSIGLVLTSKYKALLKEYSARKVKLSVTGIGSSDKDAVQRMICNILHIKDPKLSLDTSDAIAISLCAYFETLGKHQIKQPGLKLSTKKWSMDSIRELGLKVRKEIRIEN